MRDLLKEAVAIILSPPSQSSEKSFIFTFNFYFVALVIP